MYVWHSFGFVPSNKIKCPLKNHAFVRIFGVSKCGIKRLKGRLVLFDVDVIRLRTLLKHKGGSSSTCGVVRLTTLVESTVRWKNVDV